MKTGPVQLILQSMIKTRGGHAGGGKGGQILVPSVLDGKFDKSIYLSEAIIGTIAQVEFYPEKVQIPQ